MAQQATGQERAAGWMKDPSGRHFGRYWDGEQWTEHVISPETVPGIDPVTRPEGTQVEKDRTTASGEPRPGSWESDPSGRHSTRYWDGRRWTEHVMSAARVPSIDPVVQGSLEPHRKAPSAIRGAPAAAGSESLGSPQPRPLPRRAWDGLRASARSAPWAVAVIVCGLVVIGVAMRGSPPRPTMGTTNITGPAPTTSPSAGAPVATTVPLATEAPVTVPGAPADAGAPATTVATAPATVPGSQSPVTGSPSVDPPPTVPQPGQSAADPSMSTTS